MQLGKETTVVVEGKSWTFGRLEIRVIRALRDWIREQVGDPFQKLERYLDRLPPEDQKAAIKEAADVLDQLDCFSINSPLAQKWLKTEEGATRLALELLRGGHPDITEAEAFAVMESIGQEKLARVTDDAAGELPAAGNASAPVARGRRPRGPSPAVVRPAASSTGLPSTAS